MPPATPHFSNSDPLTPTLDGLGFLPCYVIGGRDTVVNFEKWSQDFVKKTGYLQRITPSEEESPVVKAVSRLPWWRRYYWSANYLTQESPWADLIDKAMDSTYLASSVISYLEACMQSNPERIDLASEQFIHQNIGFAILLFILINVLGFASSKVLSSKNFQYIRETIWPCFRSILSGLKNGRHATVSLGFMISHLANVNGYTSFNPVGIGVGVLTGVVLYHHFLISAGREKDQKKNIETIAHIQSIMSKSIDQSFSGEKITQDMSVVTVETPLSGLQKMRNFAYASLDGLVDGPYLFNCLLVLCLVKLSVMTAGVPLVLCMAGLAVFALCSLISKCSTEREKQFESEAVSDEANIKKSSLEIKELSTKVAALDAELKAVEDQIDMASQSKGEVKIFQDSCAELEYFFKDDSSTLRSSSPWRSRSRSCISPSVSSSSVCLTPPGSPPLGFHPASPKGSRPVSPKSFRVDSPTSFNLGEDVLQDGGGQKGTPPASPVRVKKSFACFQPVGHIDPKVLERRLLGVATPTPTQKMDELLLRKEKLVNELGKLNATLDRKRFHLNRSKELYRAKYCMEPGQMYALIAIKNLKSTFDKSCRINQKILGKDFQDYRMLVDEFHEAEKAFFETYGHDWERIDGLSSVWRMTQARIKEIEATLPSVLARRYEINWFPNFAKDVCAMKDELRLLKRKRASILKISSLHSMLQEKVKEIESGDLNSKAKSIFKGICKQANEVHDHQQQYACTYNPKRFYQSRSIRGIWTVLRGLESGAKNANAAIKFLGSMFLHYVLKPIVILSLAAVAIVPYALYLGFKELVKFSKRFGSPAKVTAPTTPAPSVTKGEVAAVTQVGIFSGENFQDTVYTQASSPREIRVV